MESDRGLYKIINDWFAGYVLESDIPQNRDVKELLERDFETVFRVLIDFDELLQDCPEVSIPMIENAQISAFARLGQITYQAMKNQGTYRLRKDEGGS